MAAMQPGRIPLYLLHGNVLRAPHPGQKFVEEDEDMVDVGLEFLQGDAAMGAMAVAKRKSGADGCHPTAPEALVLQCSSDALGEAGEHPEQITPPSCTPWEYRNIYRSPPFLPLSHVSRIAFWAACGGVVPCRVLLHAWALCLLLGGPNSFGKGVWLARCCELGAYQPGVTVYGTLPGALLRIAPAHASAAWWCFCGALRASSLQLALQPDRCGYR